MANLVAVNELTEVPQLETTTQALGGPGGPMNAQAQALLNRLKNHVDNTNNPHAVTKAQVGLGNCDNTSDADKPISTATQAALDLKADASGSGRPGAAYAHYLCALLEPDAIEPMQTGLFTYSIDASHTKYMIMGWATAINGQGRMEQRNPGKAMPLRGCTLNGLQTASSAVLIDPTIPVYADPWSTYYQRMQKIAELQTKNISITVANQQKPFLPGAYGAIITHYTCFDFAWLILQQSNTYGPNLGDENSDTVGQRRGDSLCIPVSKVTAGEIASSSYSIGTPAGSVSYVLLPSDWSVVADPISPSYAFRDDFMASALDSGVWSITQSANGNVAIDTQYQWCKLRGNGTWGYNALMVTAATARAEGKTLVVDVFCARATVYQGVAVEWNNGAGYVRVNGAHRVEFGSKYYIYVSENGVNKAMYDAGWTIGGVYRVKIALHADGSATYSIQGGKEYPAIGGNTWHDITPGTSYSPDNSLHPSASAYGAYDYYISDVRVY
jgi:hypothetical protein